MNSAEYDLCYLQAGLEQFESYLLSKDIYRPIGVRPPGGDQPYPQLTLGWLLLTRLRLKAVIQPGKEQIMFDQLETSLQAYRTRWRSAWDRKATAEFRARLTLWSNFLDDLKKDFINNIDRYAYEVNRRALLQILLDEIENKPQADLHVLQGLDAWLETRFQPGTFIWDPAWASSFPESSFWFLYGDLKKI